MQNPENGRRARPPLLTRAEFDVYLALEDLLDRLGYAPSHTQLLEQLGWSPKSRGSLNAYLKRLHKHGVVDGVGRSLRIIR